MFYADLLRYGGFVRGGAVQRLSDHDGGGDRQSGDAYAHGDHRGLCHGRYCADWQICGREGRAVGGENGRRVCGVFRAVCGGAHRGATALCKFNYKRYAYPCGGGEGDKAVSGYLFCGGTLYHGVQCDQQYFPWGG